LWRAVGTAKTKAKNRSCADMRPTNACPTAT
jgi:hypothetical protein